VLAKDSVGAHDVYVLDSWTVWQIRKRQTESATYYRIKRDSRAASKRHSEKTGTHHDRNLGLDGILQIPVFVLYGLTRLPANTAYSASYSAAIAACLVGLRRLERSVISNLLKIENSLQSRRRRALGFTHYATVCCPDPNNPT
jgi:hypothetical protein